MNRYEIQDVVGVGGMGAVYRARDLHFPNAMKIVAIKEMINPAGDPDLWANMVKNFEREANILVTLSHLSIPRIFDYFTYDERSYLVLEFVKGMDLERVIEEVKGFIPEKRVIGWAIELCDVLHYLHNHKPEPIIFRDVKPSNVMINQFGHVVLIDFGIAKNFTVGKKGTMIGTEGYAPPEQYRGEATHLADVYSLGATLHHVLTKMDPRLEAPFTFGERAIRKINPNVSQEMEAVVDRALQYNPEDRYSSVLEMKDALMGVASDTGISSTLSLPQRMHAVQEVTQSPQDRLVWAYQCTDEIRGSPLVEVNIVFFGSYDHYLYALTSDQGKEIWKTGTGGGVVTRPYLYGDTIYFGSEDGNVYAVSIRTGKVIWTYKTPNPVRCSPDFAEGHLFIGSDDGFLYAINSVTGRPAWRVDAGDAIRSKPVVQDHLILFGTEGGELICVDMRGNVKWRFRAKRAIVGSPFLQQGYVFFTSLDGGLYAADIETGSGLWRFAMGKGSISTPCGVGEQIFSGSADGNIYCVAKDTGREMWRYEVDGQVSGSPTFYNDVIYCGAANGEILALDVRNGKLIWKYKTGGAITGIPQVVDDVLFIGSLDHQMYALKV